MQERKRHPGRMGIHRADPNTLQNIPLPIYPRSLGNFLVPGDYVELVPEGTKIGDCLEVFLYKDSEDRMIATTRTPKVTVGSTAVLEVKEVSSISLFFQPFYRLFHENNVLIGDLDLSFF